MRNIRLTIAALLISMLMIMSLGCTSNSASGIKEEVIEEEHTGLANTDAGLGVETMKLIIDGKEIPVTWEDNESIAELVEYVSGNDLSIDMSMYGGWEQVGHLGRSFSRDDVRVTAHNGDIMLYSGNQVVLFYGDNTWEYTKLGHMDLSEGEVTDLLSNGDITIALCGN